MQIPLLIEPISGNRYRARCVSTASLSVEASSADESLRLWREKYQSVLPADAEIVLCEQPAPSVHPWAEFVGDLKDSPLFDEWQAAIEEYRRERDPEDYPS